ncbi:MAG: DUF72 domain-containing protein [Chromatiales bacterium]
MGTILVGTASWADPRLIKSGLFYPRSCKTAEQRLQFYAEQFAVVEVDSSYYAMPNARNATLWAERTPPDFTFDVKAFRVFTHHKTAPAALPKDIREALGTTADKNVYYKDVPGEIMDELWKRFREALEPLRIAGKLGAVLFQFPPWVVRRKENLDHILSCASKLSGLRLAIEFRNRTWLDEEHRDEILHFERQHGFVHVVVDEPQGFPSSVPQIWESTVDDIAIVRLHGRNAQTWQKSGLSSSMERFDYLYSEEELLALCESIRALASRVGTVRVYFNNNQSNYAQRNAAEMQEMLSAE